MKSASAARVTRPADDGRYAGRIGNRSVTLRISSDGRRVRDVRAYVPMLCPSVTPGTFTTQIGTLRVARARIAPDGRFVSASTAGGAAQRVRGRLSLGRVLSGRVELSLGNCVGSSAYTARRTGP